jgi:hypothetical protein
MRNRNRNTAPRLRTWGRFNRWLRRNKKELLP